MCFRFSSRWICDDGVPLEYLLAAAFMGAPAGLLLAKIIIPETEKQNNVERVQMIKDTESKNVIDAAARGATEGLKIAAGVGALLLAFISLIFLLNTIIGSIGGIFGIGTLTLEQILGYVFSPLALLIGVPWDEALKAGFLYRSEVCIKRICRLYCFCSRDC